MLAAQLKLEIGPALGHFYLTPRQVSKKEGDQWVKVWTCLPIIGFQGYIELAYRSGRVEKIETFLIRKGDKFDHGANSERGRFFDWSPADYDEVRDMAKKERPRLLWAGGTATMGIVNVHAALTQLKRMVPELPTATRFRTPLLASGLFALALSVLAILPNLIALLPR